MFEIREQSESSVVLTFGDLIGEDTLYSILRVNTAIRNSPFPGFIETVPAYTTLTIYYSPAQLLHDNSLSGKRPLEKLTNYLKQLPARFPVGEKKIARATIEIPVCYEVEFAPDLEEVARLNKISTSDVIHIHSSETYTVYMLGFMPGFAYLGGLSEKIAAPRRSTPRPRVPSGSVGIAGTQTGIYPFASPGGWQLIGQTPLCLFDARRSTPTLLKPGDRLRFVPVSESEFSGIKASGVWR